MKRYIILGIIVIAIGIAAYYGRYFFITEKINEEIPASMKDTIKILEQGNFQEIDFIHKGSGKALILEDAEGQKLLRFEDFKVTNGPDLYVYLTRTQEPDTTESLGDFINLGRLKGTDGPQNYEITQSIEGYNTVVIWCQRFGVLFSFAMLW